MNSLAALLDLWQRLVSSKVTLAVDGCHDLLLLFSLNRQPGFLLLHSTYVVKRSPSTIKHLERFLRPRLFVLLIFSRWILLIDHIVVNFSIGVCTDSLVE